MNLVRNILDKINRTISLKWADAFNNWIEK
jgi:hypothetical protein